MKGDDSGLLLALRAEQRASGRADHHPPPFLGPFLVALAWPGATIKRGMPAPLRRMAEHPAIGSCIDVVQQPVLAAILFVGSPCS